MSNKKNLEKQLNRINQPYISFNFLVIFLSMHTKTNVFSSVCMKLVRYTKCKSVSMVRRTMIL